MINRKVHLFLFTYMHVPLFSRVNPLRHMSQIATSLLQTKHLESVQPVKYLIKYDLS